MKNMLKMRLVGWLLSVLTDPATRERVREAVAFYADADISNEEKRYRAKQRIQKYSGALVGFALNLAIELAVAELKTFE